MARFLNTLHEIILAVTEFMTSTPECLLSLGLLPDLTSRPTQASAPCEGHTLWPRIRECELHGTNPNGLVEVVSIQREVLCVVKSEEVVV